MEDAEIVRHINELVGDYRHLERQHGGTGLSPDQRRALADIQAEIDRSWANLRRRRACRDAGVDPDNPPAPTARPVRGRP